MKDPEYVQEIPEAVRQVSANSPNDSERNQTANKNVRRFCNDSPKVPNEDQMGKGGY